MAAVQNTITFDVQDCKVYPVLTDTVSGITYGAAVDVVGIQEVSVEPNFVSVELKGDGKVLAKKGKIDRLNFKASHAELALNVLAVLYGGTVAASGTGSAEVSSLKYDGGSLPYFKIEFLINDLEASLAECVFVLNKCQVTGGTLISSSTDNFGKPSFDAEAILPIYSTAGFGQTIFRETASGLSA